MRNSKSSKQKEATREHGNSEINVSSDKLISKTISTVANYYNCCDIHTDAVVLHSEENKDTAICSVTKLSSPHCHHLQPCSILLCRHKLPGQVSYAFSSY